MKINVGDFFSKGLLFILIGVLFITGFDVTSLSKTDWLGIFSGVGAGLDGVARPVPSGAKGRSAEVWAGF